MNVKSLYKNLASNLFHPPYMISCECEVSCEKKEGISDGGSAGLPTGILDMVVSSGSSHSRSKVVFQCSLGVEESQ